MTNKKEEFYSLKNSLPATGVVLLYLLISWLLVGFRNDQLVLAGVFFACYFSSVTARKFIIAFSIFIVYWVIFDYMKAFPNYAYNQVHLLQLYSAEKNLFGSIHNGTQLTPNEYWLTHTSTWLDILSGFFYLCWIPVPLAFATWLFFRDKNNFLQFSFTFVLVNFIGFVIYYVYPAAPPWYFQKYGNAFIANTPGSSAGLQRFDDFFNLGIFKSIYAKSSNVFAAMPSLHSSYPVIVLYYGLKIKMGQANILFAIVTAGIWFAAVYTSHHYVLDVLAGITCALTAIFIFQKLLMRSSVFNKLLQFYLSKI
jgi:inositol phosphorylceramide synthase catalytic subunit